jgi:hypothetical protein
VIFTAACRRKIAFKIRTVNADGAGFLFFGSFLFFCLQDSKEKK